MFCIHQSLDPVLLLFQLQQACIKTTIPTSVLAGICFNEEEIVVLL